MCQQILGIWASTLVGRFPDKADTWDTVNSNLREMMAQYSYYYKGKPHPKCEIDRIQAEIDRIKEQQQSDSTQTQSNNTLLSLLIPPNYLKLHPVMEAYNIGSTQEQAAMDVMEQEEASSPLIEQVIIPKKTL